MGLGSVGCWLTLIDNNSLLSPSLSLSLSLNIQAPTAPSHGATGSQYSPGQRFDKCMRCEQNRWTGAYLYDHDPTRCTRSPRRNFASRETTERTSSADKFSDKSGKDGKFKKGGKPGGKGNKNFRKK